MGEDGGSREEEGPQEKGRPEKQEARGKIHFAAA